MLSFVLAAVVITTPATVEEGCDQAKLQVLLGAQKEDRIPVEMELDRRIAATLAEERRAAAEVARATEEAKAALVGAQRFQWAGWALAVLGLVVMLVAAQRRSMALAATAFGLAVLMAVIGNSARSGPRAAQEAVTEATARQLALTQCRFRVTDARMQMMQTRIAKTTYDLDEADEDIWGWVTRLENNQEPVTSQMLRKLHNEIRESLKY